MDALGDDALDAISQKKQEIYDNIKVSFKEVEVDAPSIRELVQRLIEHLPHVVDACAEGLDAALEVLAIVKRLRAAIEPEEKRLLELALEEAQWFSKTELKQEFGLTLLEVADTLNYSDDQEYKLLKSQLDGRKARLKAAYKSLSTRFEAGEYVDEETGEALPVVRVKKFGGQTLKRV